MNESAMDDIERETHRVLAQYTRRIDSKQWDGLSDVFADDCVKERLGMDGLSGEILLSSGAAIIADLAANLGKCGPTQHLLGNHVVTRHDGKDADSLTYVRAFHRGAGANAEYWFDVVGEYHVGWRLTSQGWRAVRWCLQMINAVGDPRAVRGNDA